MESTWSAALVCNWSSIHPGDGPDVIVIQLPKNNCTDMRGAIKIARAVMPKVTTIYTVAGGKLDTLYLKTGKEWGCFDIREKAA